MPTVSVIIPTYNRAQYVCEAIDSVLTQTYKDFEIIVVDDGSTDNTPTLVPSYGPPVKYIRQDNQGVSTARNRGIYHASGKYVAFLDSDDMFYPDKLSVQVSVMEAHPRESFSFTDYSQGPNLPPKRIGRAKRHRIDPDDIFYSLCRRIIVHTVTVMAKREELLSVGLFDPTLRAAEDFDLWLRLSRRHAGRFIENVLTFHREHSQRTMRTLMFHRNYCNTYTLQLRRWNQYNASLAERKALHRSYIDTLLQLGWCERRHGNVRNAGGAFLRAAKLDPAGARWKHGMRGLVYYCCPWVIKAVCRLRKDGRMCQS